MFYIILSIPLLILCVVGIVYYKLRGQNCSGDAIRGDGFAFGMVVIFCLLTIGFIIASLVCTSKNAFNKEDLKKVQKCEQIYTEKANLLTMKFSNYLAEIYPNLEKSIFEKISPENVSVYFVKYPELKSSHTIEKLVDEISELQDSVYAQKIMSAEIQRDIDYYYNNPWLLFTFE